jgi:hypothetical protein
MFNRLGNWCSISFLTAYTHKKYDTNVNNIN